MSPSADAPIDDRSTPLLSVVIPTHDVRPWLRQTLDSVLRQVEDMEVIVVDDRSSDGTVELAREYAARDERIAVVPSDVPGGGSARNTGADRARGRYLVFADGDDLIPDGAYAALVASLERSGSDMAIGDYLKFRAADTWRPTAAMPAFDHPGERVSILDEPSLLYSRPCWNRMWRRAFWEEKAICFPDVPRSNDIAPMVTAFLAADSIDIIPDVVYLYRERPGAGSMTARAGAATSLLSYLGQETICADLVAERGDAELSRVYANLIWDRDAFMAVVKFLSGWEEPSADDDAVAEALSGLLARTPAPAPTVAPLRQMMLELAAAGELSAARVVALVAETGVDVEDAEKSRALVSSWRDLIATLPSRPDLASEERRLLVERLARQLTMPRSVERSGDWRALVEEARESLGERVLLFSVEAWQSPSGDDDRVARRAEVAGRVTSVVGGPLLMIEGTAASDAAPALFDGEKSVADGELRLIEPASVTWTEEQGGVRTWAAAYPTAALPMHRPLTPVFRVGDEVLNVGGAPSLPPYTPRDAFLYDVVDRVVVVRRRRHWLPRAARRAAIMGAGFARRLLRR
ncbi:glycosyltransferase family 2 protein [Microbacterium sp. G2-8]|uniref:glycosyltransferase family 2 protein n=1 Tax=Microbacterium sp. G2-8 TaxID=2842454 RepID=UPI001C8A2810|nr:glycosyltransferase family 2 protein [Microbacterium sp. G2-8]